MSTYTALEKIALSYEYDWARAESDIEACRYLKFEKSLGSVYEESYQNSYLEIEKRFSKSFFNFFSLSSALQDEDCIYHFYSASDALLVAFRYLGSKCKRIGVCCPVFDAIADLLKLETTGCELVPFVEEIDGRDSFTNSLINRRKAIDALVLVLPCNPTGFELSEEDFRKLARSCSDDNITLVIDMCWRFQSLLMNFDPYAILQAENTKFIIIEDTGKMFNIGGLKVGMLVTAKHIADDLSEIHESLVLEIPRFTMKLLIDIFETVPRKRVNDLWNVASQNRILLRDSLPTKTMSFQSNIGMEFVQCKSRRLAQTIVDVSRENGIFLLPGMNMYWDSYGKGRSTLRIALNREPKKFAAGLQRFTDICVDIL